MSRICNFAWYGVRSIRLRFVLLLLLYFYRYFDLFRSTCEHAREIFVPQWKKIGFIIQMHCRYSRENGWMDTFPFC